MTELDPEVDSPTLVAGLWVDPSALDDSRLQEIPNDDPLLRQQVLRASEVLFVASGRRWSGGTTRRIVTVDVAGGCGLPARGHYDGLPVPRRLGFRVAPADLTLPDWPVTEVISVSRDGVAVDADQYQLRDGRRLHRPAGWGAGSYEIAYDHGAMPPAGGRAAAAVLAIEYYLAATGSTGCRLPKRVSSITRQSVTMTLLDPMEFLDKGRTGVLEVDQWLVSINPTGARSRARVWSPDIHQPISTTT